MARIRTDPYDPGDAPQDPYPKPPRPGPRGQTDPDAQPGDRPNPITDKPGIETVEPGHLGSVERGNFGNNFVNMQAYLNAASGVPHANIATAGGPAGTAIGKSTPTLGEGGFGAAADAVPSNTPSGNYTQGMSGIDAAVTNAYGAAATAPAMTPANPTGGQKSTGGTTPTTGTAQPGSLPPQPGGGTTAPRPTSTVATDETMKVGQPAQDQDTIGGNFRTMRNKLGGP